MILNAETKFVSLLQFEAGVVKCEGLVMSSSSGEMISGSCSVANGMSGAPVFSQARQLIGINVGGAALKFQYAVVKFYHSEEERRESAVNYFDNLKIK
jgi:hypothetical protein